jgi:hypothetical protein
MLDSFEYGHYNLYRIVKKIGYLRAEQAAATPEMVLQEM